MIKVHNKGLGKLLKNEYVYYAVLVLSVISVVKYLLSRNVYCLLSFVAIVILTSKFLTKNKTLPFVFALFASSFLLGCGKIIEGMDVHDVHGEAVNNTPEKENAPENGEEQAQEQPQNVYKDGSEEQITTDLKKTGGFTKQASNTREQQQLRSSGGKNDTNSKDNDMIKGRISRAKKSKNIVNNKSADSEINSNQGKPSFLTNNQEKSRNIAIIHGVGSSFGTVGSAFGAAFGTAGTAAGTAVGTAETAVGTVGSAVGTVGSALGNTVGTAIGTAFGTVNNFITDLFN